MSSWLFSWLPAFPSINIALPSSIQSRFLSFVLKKSLGHLLKPSQLDSLQIDSQIGSGYVRVNNIELNNESINDYLVGLPVRLQDGTLSSAVVRIPWPNPLTSNVGLKLQSLHLVFHVLPFEHQQRRASINLADSVASVAESFVNELSPREEATIWDSFHSELATSIKEDGPSVPGGIDPFSHLSEGGAQGDTDPAGVSIFATLIERLLARFEFEAKDIRITLVEPDNMSLTLSLSEISYYTDSKQSDPTLGINNEASDGQIRTLSISGIQVTAQNLRAPYKPASPQSPLTPTTFPLSGNESPSSPLTPHAFNSGRKSISPGSSSSSLDEDTQFAMSQSLAFLPPRPDSPSSSMSGSIYQSAISIAEEHKEHSNLGAEQQSNLHIAIPTTEPALPRDVADVVDTCEDILLSFGLSPIIIQAKTPPPLQTSPQDSPFSDGIKTQPDALKISVKVGLIACAIQAWHVGGILHLLDTWVSSMSEPAADSPLESSGPRAGVDFDLNLNVRGIILLVVPPSNDNIDGEIPSLSDFFEHPLVPPTLPRCYVRSYLESISGVLSLRVNRVLPPNNSKAPEGERNSLSTSLEMSIGDISIFSFNHPITKTETGLVATPILITDPHLTSQYYLTHDHPSDSTNNHSSLPHFEIIDWTDEKYSAHGTRLSMWRSKIPRKNVKSDGLVLPTQSGATPGEERMDIPTSIYLSIPAITIRGENSLSKKNRSQNIDVKIVPLHLFVDLGKALHYVWLSFIEKVLESMPRPPATNKKDPSAIEGFDRHNVAQYEQDKVTLGPHSRVALEREKERKRLERLVLEDLDLGYDYRNKEGTPKHRSPHGRSRKQRRSDDPNRPEVVLHFSMIRIELRCPSPLTLQSRSGAVIIDVHGIDFTNTMRKNSTRFANLDPWKHQAREPDNTSVTHLFGANCKRIVFASSATRSNVAKSFVSIGSLASTPDDTQGMPEASSVSQALKPRIELTRSQTSTPTTALSLNIPSIHVEFDKDILDGLQYWADDVTQLLERTFGIDNIERGDSKDTILIGSHFFGKSRSGSGSRMSMDGGGATGEFVMTMIISEAYIQLHLPRSEEGTLRPFIITSSDLNILVELRPEGKDQTVVTVGIMDVVVKDLLPSSTNTILSLTSPRSLSSAPKQLVKLRFTSLVVPETASKETSLKVTLCGFTFNLYPDIRWIADLGLFFKPPPGAFESVVPTDRTKISVKIVDGSLRALAPVHPGAIVVYIGDANFSTDVTGESPHKFFQINFLSLALLAIDNTADTTETSIPTIGVAAWKASGYALLADVEDLRMNISTTNVTPPDTQVDIGHITLRIHLCADSIAAVSAFATDLGSVYKQPAEEQPKHERRPTVVSEVRENRDGLMSSVEDVAFKQMPEIGPPPDMIADDLPTNLDYLDESFGAAAGLRELRDDDLEDFDDSETSQESVSTPETTGLISKIGGETIRMLQPNLKITENYFENLPPDASENSGISDSTTLRVRIRDSDVTLLLYDGYDWVRTRKTIEEEVKEMRRRLARIKQLIASGQTQDPAVEDTSTLLFNSVYIGLEQDVDSLEPGALIAAIDEELRDDLETASQSSWQSLKPVSGKPSPRSTKLSGKRLKRSKGPSMEFKLLGLNAELDQFQPEEELVSRTFVTVKDLEILDHIKTSTWKKFLTELRSDSKGNIRESDSNMVRIELRNVRPVPGDTSQEVRLRAKILPLRLYVDQDAVDFLKKFFSFKDPNASPTEGTSDGEAYIQLAEIFAVDLKLDYKPRRVDYRALREGRTIELMNFFHFDGAEMTLRHITLSGVQGWPRLFEMLNDLWTPDVKATQLAEVISGVAPIRSVVNVGSGLVDLVLLPISQYKKDGRIVRGIQKGATAFVKSTAIEAIKMGARLATGTQVILEQAEGVLGGQFSMPVTAEMLQVSGDEVGEREFAFGEDDEDAELYSKYAQQPTDIKEGVQHAYKSLHKNFSSAAQTILAVPMEVYERSGNEGPVRSVIRAVPIAVLKPMIGASEAVSKTLQGLHNTLDPNLRHENEAKYKHR